MSQHFFSTYACAGALVKDRAPAPPAAAPAKLAEVARAVSLPPKAVPRGTFVDPLAGRPARQRR